VKAHANGLVDLDALDGVDATSSYVRSAAAGRITSLRQFTH